MNPRYYWGALILDSVDLFIKNDFNKSDYLIFLLLCKELDPDTNVVNLNQKNIIIMLNEEYGYQITKGTVSKSINKLLDNHFITKAKRRQGFMVNPNLFYQGTPYYLSDKTNDFDDSLRSIGEQPTFYLDTNSKKLVYYAEQETAPQFDN